ncbi:MAG: hypothetical protein ACRCZE_00280 [Candidatus Altimarinota bacterium]
MIEDQIRLSLTELGKLKEELKQIKKDLKFEEKIDSQEFLDLEKAYKDLRKQMKDFKDQWERELLEEPTYQKLRELKVKKEEDIADESAKLFASIAKLPQKYVDLNLDTENGPVKIQIQPEMRLYLNGREEKKRTNSTTLN